MFKIFSQKKINFVQDAVQKVFLIKKNKKESKIYKIIKYLCLAILAIFVFFIIFLAANFFAVKQIYQETILGKNNLEQAVAFTQMQNFSQAKIFAKSSSINFLTAITGAEQLKDSWLIKRLPYFKNQINNAEYLLTSVEFLSQATSQSAGFGQELESGLGGKKLTFSKFSREEKQNILQQFYQATPELNGLKANIALALINLEQVDLTGWLFFLKNRINELKEQLFQAKLF